MLTSTRMIDACIFDLDGVIVDTAKYHYLAWKRLADHLEIPFDEEDNERMKGISRRASLDRLLALGDKQYSERDIQKYYLTKNVWYLESVEGMDQSEILPGVVEFIETLETAHVKIALGSASKNARHILGLIGLSERFDAIVDGNDVVRSKPDPEVFLNGAKLLGSSPDRTLVFEDSAKGIDAAIAGGFRTVGIGQVMYLGHADMVVSGFNALTLEQITDKIFVPSH